MLHEDSKTAVAHLVNFHSAHYPDGAEKTHVSLSTRPNAASSHSAYNTTLAELIRLGGVPLRPLSQTPLTPNAYKAESARLSLELTLWKDFKFVQEHLPDDELCRSIDKQRAKDEKWCEDDLLDTTKQFFDMKAYQVYQFWILERVMQMAEEASVALQDVIANGSLDDTEAKHYGKTAEEWMRLFDLYHVIADATRGTISEIEQVSLDLSSVLATRAGSELRFEDVRYVFMMFAATVNKATDTFAGVPYAADKTNRGDKSFVGRLGALSRQISYLMNWAVSWSIAAEDLPSGWLVYHTPEQEQQRMLDFLGQRAERFRVHSSVWQEIVPHIEGKMLDLVSQEAAGNAVPATLYEELERAKKAAIGNLMAAWEMEQQVRMTRVRFNEVNRGSKVQAQQWASVEAGSSQSGHFFPEARLFRPARDQVARTAKVPKVPTAAASVERPANEGGNAAQRQPTPDEDDLPDYEDSGDENAAASKEQPANKDGDVAPRQATPDIDDLPDYEDFEDDEGVPPPKQPEATTERQSRSPSPPPPSDKAEHPGTAPEKPEEDDTRSPRYSLSPSPPPAPPSPANDQPGPSATNARDPSPPASPSNKRKRSASPPDEEEEDASRSPRQSPTPSPPPPKRARSTSPAHSPPPPPPPPSKTPSPPPAPPSPSPNQAAADVVAPPAASSSNKRKRTASLPEEEAEEEAAADNNRSPHHSPTPSPPPAKRARSTSPAPSPPPPKIDTDPEEEDHDEPESSTTTKKPRRGPKPAAKSKKGKGKAAAAGATQTGRVTKPKPKTPHKKKDYRAEAEANGGVRRSKRVQEMKK